MIESSCHTRRRFEVGGSLHADWAKKVLLHEIFEATIGEFLHDVSGDGRTGVAVGHARPRPPTRSSGVVVVVEALAHGHCVRRLLRVFAQVDVVPAGGVFEQVNDADGIRRSPAIFEPYLWSQLVYGIVQRKFSLIGQHEDRQRYKCLRSRSNAEQGVRCVGAIRRDIRQTQARNPFRAILVNDRY